MKDLLKNWKFLSIVAAVIAIIILLVCYLTIPAFAKFVNGLLSYIIVAIAFALAGFIGGYYVGRKYEQ